VENFSEILTITLVFIITMTYHIVMVNEIISSFFTTPFVMTDERLLEALAFWTDPYLGRLKDASINADGSVSVLYYGEALIDAETMSRSDATEIFGTCLL
jgi:hypothetical protein